MGQGGKYTIPRKVRNLIRFSSFLVSMNHLTLLCKPCQVQLSTTRIYTKSPESATLLLRPDSLFHPNPPCSPVLNVSRRSTVKEDTVPFAMKFHSLTHHQMKNSPNKINETPNATTEKVYAFIKKHPTASLSQISAHIGSHTRTTALYHVNKLILSGRIAKLDVKNPKRWDVL